MALLRGRDDFWGEGPPWQEVAGFSFHCLRARAPEDEVSRHSHAEAHFILVLSNGYMSSATGAPAVSGTPLLVFNPPGTTHRDRFHGGRGRFIAISGGDNAREGPALVLRDPYTLWTAHRIAGQLQSVAKPLQLEAHALQLMAAVQAPSSDEARGAVCPPSWLGRAVEMIYTSDDPSLRVTDVATEAGVHPVHLARVFRDYLKCSPGETLQGRRLERAAALLGSGKASLAQIAQGCGFTDQAHLNRVFRRRLQITPTGWRRERHVASVQDEADGEL